MTGPGATIPSRTGVDQRSVDRAAKRKEELEQATGKKAKVSIHDPYFYIVEVTLYGQARFYNPPPPRKAAPSRARHRARRRPHRRRRRRRRTWLPLPRPPETRAEGRA